MATIQLGSPGRLGYSYSDTQERFSVWVKRLWSDKWQYVPFLYPENSRVAAFPEESEAELTWEYGTYRDLWGLGSGYLLPANIDNWYIQIRVHTAYGSYISFIGIVVGYGVTDEGIDSATGIPRGLQAIKAKGLEYLLSRRVIVGTWAYNPIAAQEIYLPATRQFNRRNTRGVSLQGNRSDTVGPSGAYLFSPDGNLWSALDIVSYILTLFQPDEPSFRITGQYDALRYIFQDWDFHGKTVWDAINQIVDRRRGMGMKIVTDGIGDVNIEVFSLSQYNLSGPDFSIAANTRQVDIRVDDDPHIDMELDVLSMAAVDEIIVEGAEPIKCAATLGVAGGSLEEAWTAEEEDDYVEGTEYDRSSDDLSRVFSLYRIPKDFVPYGIVPYVDNLGNVFPAVQGTYWLYDQAFLRHLPWYDETAALDAEPEYREPFAVFQIPDSDPVAYNFLDRMDANGLQSGSLRMADRELAVELKGPANHYFALNAWDGEGAAVAPALDYTTMLVTVNIPTDQKPRVRMTIMNQGQASPNGRQLYIELPDVEVWMVANNTVMDVDSAGALVLFNGGTGAIVRDDSYKLRSVAFLAWVWYGQQRAAARFTIKNHLPWFALGSMVRTAISGLGWQRVGTCVTTIQHSYQDGVQTVSTGYGEMDGTRFTESVLHRMR